MVRSYSIASPPEERRVVVTIERLDDGEVSPYLVDEVRPGDELEVIYTYTRSQPPGWTRYSRRIDTSLLEEVAPGPDDRPLIHICGPTTLVEEVASGLVTLGYEPARIRTERFGPTGR
jgi:ferredoxin-NADP reductase